MANEPAETPPPLTRGELYKAVWATPVERLARTYGISGVGLSKLCRRHRIPIPPRGHWAKPPRRRPEPLELAELKGPFADSVLLAYRPPGANTAGSVKPPRVDTASSGEHAPALRVEVAADLANPHPLVARTLKALRMAARRAPVGVQVPLQLPFEGKPLLQVEVTANSADRAMLLSDALLKAIEARGHSCREAMDPRHPDRHPGIHLLDGEDWFTCVIHEEVEQLPHVPTKSEERRARMAGRHWSPPDWDTRATGRLQLLLYSEDRNRIRAWGDGKIRRLEDHLGAFILAMEKSARRARELRAEWARVERERAGAERRRKEEEERRKAEQARIDALCNEASAWRNARTLRAYLTEVRAQTGDALATDSELQAWLEWGSGVADRMDPLPRRRPRTMVPAPPVPIPAPREEE